MTRSKTYYKSRVRAKGQITLPNPVRELLNLDEGDGVIFYVREGRVVIERERTIDPEQAWFWSERWQQMERAAQSDIDSGRVTQYSSIEEALDALKGQDEDAED
jgi:AbrB family looped-hinge helix DNA binding protein